VVYLIVIKVQGNSQYKWDPIREKLDGMGATPAVTPSVWIAASEQSAPELYLELSQGLELPYSDNLLICEITTNSIGTYFVEGGDKARAIAALIGSARRV
jgi:hypothetical protein